MARRINAFFLFAGSLAGAWNCSVEDRALEVAEGQSGAAGGSGGTRATGGSGGGGAADSSTGGDADGAAGSSGQGGDAGANDAGCDGPTCPCESGATRPCSEGGSFGKCADGEQTCGDAGSWGPCSITPDQSDTCETGNDDNCNGVVNEDCPCTAGASRSCSDAGLRGPCAEGTQTCTTGGQWGPCSIAPAAQDTCVQGNDADCDGTPNEGCLCIEGVTRRDCGVCADGSQVCTSGRTNQFGSCTGGSTMRTYYRDQDGDGHASQTAITVCGSAPAGYITGPTDDCYDLNADARPGQTSYFRDDRGDGSFDYNCNGTEEKIIAPGSALLLSGCSGGCPGGCSSTGTGTAPNVACGGGFQVPVGCACMGPAGCGVVFGGPTQTCR